MNISAKIFSCALFLLWSMSSLAHKTELIAGVHGGVGGELIPNAVLDVQEQWISPDPNLLATSSEAQVWLHFDDTHGEYIEEFSATITYNILIYNHDLEVVNYTNHQLDVNYVADASQNYEDQVIMRYPNAHHAIVTVVDVDVVDGNGSPIATPAALYLDLKVITNRKYKMNETEIYFKYNPTLQADGNLALTWTHLEGAESYDLEWLFVDISDGSSSDYIPDFRQASRINVSTNFYDLPVLFPEGYVIFRVRGVGYLDETDSQMFSTSWYPNTSSNPSIDYNSTTLASYDALITQHRNVYKCSGYEADLNWQYSIAFAEEGKRSEASTYYDELLRPMQSVSVNNTNDRALIQPYAYDALGRSTVGVMAYATTNQGTRFYQSDYNALIGDLTIDKFDYAATVFDPQPMATTYGPGKYYSSGNPMLGPNGHYIPDAAGFTYSRVVYSNDGLGRVVAAGGVGETHQIGNRDSRYYYSVPNQVELDRLFGNEAGNASKYQKVTSVDPNGQASVQYIDPKGRVVATALSGEPPKALELGTDINRLTPIDGKPAPETMVENLVPFNILDETEGTWQLIHPFVTTQPEQTVSFQYSLNGAQVCFECDNDACGNTVDECAECPCPDCVYDLRIELKKDDALIPLATELEGGATSTSDFIEVAEFTNQSVIKFSCVLTDPGTYYIIKTLSLHEEVITGPDFDETTTIENWFNQYIQNQTPQVGAQNWYLWDFLFDTQQTGGVWNQLGIVESARDGNAETLSCLKYPEIVDECPDCPRECIELIRTEDNCGVATWFYTDIQNETTTYFTDTNSPLANKTEILNQLEAGTLDEYLAYFIPDTEIISDLIAELYNCLSNCDAVPVGIVDPCEIHLSLMEADMSPGGQYFDNMLDGQVSDTPNAWLSTNIIEIPEAISNGSLSMTWDDVRDNWNPEWVEALIEFHPEMCLYLNYCARCKLFLTDNNWSEVSDLEEVEFKVNIDNSIAMSCGAEIVYDPDLERLKLLTEETGFYEYEEKMREFLVIESEVGDIFGNQLYNKAFNPLNLVVESDYNEVGYNPFPATFGTEYLDKFSSISDGSLEMVYYFEMANHLLNFVPTGLTGSSDMKYFSIYYMMDDPHQWHLAADYTTFQSTLPTNLSSITNAQFNDLRALFQSLHGGNGDNDDEGYVDDEELFNSGLVTKYQFFTGIYTFLRQYLMYQDIYSDITVNTQLISKMLHDIPLMNSVTGLDCHEHMVFPEINMEGYVTTSLNPIEHFITHWPKNTFFENLGTPVDANEDGHLDNFDNSEMEANLDGIMTDLMTQSETILECTDCEGVPYSCDLCEYAVEEYVDKIMEYYGCIADAEHQCGLRTDLINFAKSQCSAQFPEGNFEGDLVYYSDFDNPLMTYAVDNLEDILAHYDTEEPCDAPLIDSWPFIENEENECRCDEIHALLSNYNNSDGLPFGIYGSDNPQEGWDWDITESEWSEITSGWAGGLTLEDGSGAETSLAEVWEYITDQPYNADYVLPLSVGGELQGLIWEHELFALWRNNCSKLHTIYPNPVQWGFYPSFLKCGSSITTPEPEVDPCEPGEPLGEDALLAQHYADINLLDQTKQLANTLIQNYKTHCFEGISDREQMIMSYDLNEYAYTLYFYDQANNLIKTISPEGVHPLPIPPYDANATSWQDYISDNAAYDVNISAGEYVWGGYSGVINVCDVEAHRNATAPAYGATSDDAPFVHTDLVRVIDPDIAVHTLIIEYHYNSLGQSTVSTIPDYSASTDETSSPDSRLWYDPLGRIVLSQNPKQRSKGKFSYTFYDALGRAYESGVASPHTETDITAIPTAAVIDGEAVVNWDLSTYEGAKEMTNYEYSEFVSIIQTYFLRSEVARTQFDAPLSTEISDRFPMGQRNLRNRVTSTLYYDTYSEGSELEYRNASHFTYDIHGNIDYLIQENKDLEDMLQSFKTIAYTYDLVSGNVHQVAYQAGQWDQFYHRYQYDADNRLTHVETSRDALIWEQDAKYLYYDHGPLARTEIGDQQVQAMDYAYTIQGWLKSMNSSTLKTSRDIGHDGVTTGSGDYAKHKNFAQDALAYSIQYFNGDYTPVDASLYSSQTDYFLIDRYDATNNLMQTSSPDLFNGNICGITLSISSTDQLDMAMHGYAYLYDQLNRLKGMKVWTQMQDDIPGVGETNAYDENIWTNGQLGSSYIETYKYDFNGNIMDLTRRDASGDLYDNFDYTYAQSTNGKLLHNKLGHVDDSEINSALTTDLEDQAVDNYSYDEIGNLYKDQQEEIDYIEWTAFNKPRNIYRTSTSTKDHLEFVYDAAGQRIGKIVKGAGEGEETAPQLEWNYTYYVKDLDGNVMATYNGSYQAITDENWDYRHTLNLTELHVYGSSRLGIHRDHARFEKKFNATSAESETAIYFNGIPDETPDVIELGFSALNYDDVEPELPYPCSLEPCVELHTRTLGLYSYELSNHQGNVNVVISDQKIAIQNGSGNTILYYKSDIQMVADYTPFGMEMPGRVEQTDDYRYGFQGQESDSEISGSESHLSFEYRIHDGRIGKFFSVDPLTTKYPYYSTYAFSGNRLIDKIEFEGLEPTELPTSSGEIRQATNQANGIMTNWIEGDDCNTWYALTETVEFAAQRSTHYHGEGAFSWRGGPYYYHRGGMVEGKSAGWYSASDMQEIYRNSELLNALEWMYCQFCVDHLGNGQYGYNSSLSAEEVEAIRAERNEWAETVVLNFYNNYQPVEGDGFLNTRMLGELVQNRAKALSSNGSGVIESVPIEDLFFGVARGIFARLASNVSRDFNITYLTRAGNYPSWTTVRTRYWNLMNGGIVPKGKALVRIRATGQITTRMVSKELHHIEGREIVDPHRFSNLKEVWPWEHEAIDPSRHIGYDFIEWAR